MPYASYILIAACIILVIFCIQAIFFVWSLNGKIRQQEEKIDQIFLARINKIPSLIEFLRPHVVRQEAFDRTIGIHITSLISSRESVYDILENNQELTREFEFLLKLSEKVPELIHNSLFQYLKHAIIFHQEHIAQEIDIYNILVARFNRMIRIKNLTIIGYLYPKDPKIVI